MIEMIGVVEHTTHECSKTLCVCVSCGGCDICHNVIYVLCDNVSYDTHVLHYMPHCDSIFNICSVIKVFLNIKSKLLRVLLALLSAANIQSAPSRKELLTKMLNSHETTLMSVVSTVSTFFQFYYLQNSLICN